MNPANIGRDWDELESENILSIPVLPNDYTWCRPYLTPMLVKVSLKMGKKFIDYVISDSTLRRIEHGDDGVYTEMVESYIGALESNCDKAII